MSPDNTSFANLVDRAMTASTNQRSMRPVVEKEILHYDILVCLAKEGLLRDLTFQGGTSLRLCYQSSRYSEDLDFAGGRAFNSKQVDSIKACIEHYVGQRYGLSVSVKEPKTLRGEPMNSGINVDKWQVNIRTAIDRPDIPMQKIKLEIANVQAYTGEPRTLNLNYSVLPSGYAGTIIKTESLQEIMADKLVSLPASEKYIRHRDIWDLAWLAQRNVKPAPDLVQRKLDDYSISDFEDKLAKRIESLDEITASAPFKSEMMRFLEKGHYDMTVGNPDFAVVLSRDVGALLDVVKRELYPSSTTSISIPQFRL